MQHVRAHAQVCARSLRIYLRRREQADLLARCWHASSLNDFSKFDFMYARLLHPGPPVPAMLDLIGHVQHRAAVASFFSGDWFLAKHAANYFAKSFVPSSRAHRVVAAEAHVPPERVCLHCWHLHRRIYLEDEAH
eukprot:468720-Karenia_brevis.AAC.1